LRILYVCHRFPFPPKRGGKIRPFHMIRHLHEQGHRVTVASLVRSPEEAEEGKGLQAHCEKFLMERVHDPLRWADMIRRLPTGNPSSMGFFYSKRLQRGIDRELKTERYDLVFVHCSSVAQYVADVSGVPKILDFGDMDSQKWLAYGGTKRFPLSLGYYLEGLKMQLEETRLAQKFDTCTCTTRAELATLNGLGTGVHTDWFPNGVDAEAFSPTVEPYDRDQICFIGRMDYYPNQACMLMFCKDAFPLIRSRRPSSKLVIVGADPSREILALGKLDGVTVTGSVPKVQPYVLKSALTIAPLSIARGTQNKILESLAMGVPVVASHLAAQGVDVIPGDHLLTAGTPQGYADAVLRILNDEVERKRLSDAGRARMLSHHSWAHSLKRLDQIIRDTLDTNTSGHGRHAA
jgi:polysaccharide biosynthesis protein PslH